MALLFLDSFDHYVTADLLEKWAGYNAGGTSGSSAAIHASAGRRGSAGFRVVGPTGAANTNLSVQQVLAPADATCVCGFAFVPPTTAGIGTSFGTMIASIRDGSAAQVSLRINADRTLSVTRGSASGTLLGTTGAALSGGVSGYIEWRVKIDPSAGTVEVRVNGTPVLTLTGQNTRATANTSWTAIGLGTFDSLGNHWAGGSAFFDYDDLYVLDGSGAAPFADFLGDVRIDPRYPTAPGATSAWTPSTAPNWDCVNDPAPDDDTTYVSAASSPLTDTYTVQDVPVAGTAPLAVQLCLSAKKSDAGACTIAPVVRHAGVDNVGSALSPGTAYAYHRVIYPTNPGTGAAWTEAGFNAAEFGVRRTA